MHLKRRISWPPDVSALDTLNDYTLQKYLAEKSLLSALYSETLNKEYIGRIYQMSSWQFFNEFYTILRKFQYLRK